MPEIVKKILRFFRLFFMACVRSIQFLYFGVVQKKFTSNLNRMLQLISGSLFQYVYGLNIALGKANTWDKKCPYEFDAKNRSKWLRYSQGLHSLLPESVLFSYSVIIPILNPIKDSIFQETLESALMQTAPNLEVLVGFKGQLPEKIHCLLGKLKEQYPQKLRTFSVPEMASKADLINLIASEAKGNLFVFTEQDGMMRPDLLFRYEQTLRLLPEPENTLLYCDECTITKQNTWIHGSPFSRPDTLNFPYLFSTFIPGSLLVSKHLWKKVNGLREEFNNVCFYDLLLRLNLAGCQPCKIPIMLYARRHGLGLEGENALTNSIDAFRDYLHKRNLDWDIIAGYIPGTLRAIPKLKEVPLIHVIMPFKDQKKLTLAAVASLKKQIGVNIRITAVDNRSHDLSISETLEKWGVEVLKIDEPFNFSRLNNLAVQRSQLKDAELLFFMNNDVEMEENSLLEMSRWINQPNIGKVGCRLNYPNGLLQCGGLDIDTAGPSYQISWQATECKAAFTKLFLARTLRIAPSVTGAAILIKKETFVQVGGFDSIWYPIAFSDTNLSIKLQKIDLLSFYTPFATGFHHESISRVADPALEDYEASTWLQELYFSQYPIKPLEMKPVMELPLNDNAEALVEMYS